MMQMCQWDSMGGPPSRSNFHGKIMINLFLAFFHHDFQVYKPIERERLPDVLGGSLLLVLFVSPFSSWDHHDSPMIFLGVGSTFL